MTVPNIVGQPVHVAAQLVVNMGLDLTDGNLDGPSLRARTWPGLFWVTAQDPPAGMAVALHTEIRISFIADGQAWAGVPAPSVSPLPSLRAHAESEDD